MTSRKWWQRNIRAADIDNGHWELDVVRAGRYRISLRRWPAELDLPMTAAVERGKAIQVVAARLRTGGVELNRPVGPGARSVSFTLSLETGRAQLQTWLIGPDQESHGAYYATIERLD